MKLFDVPPSLDEFDGEPVEQSRVAWPQSLRAKIFAGLDQTRPEEMLPIAIDRDACRQRMVGIDQPTGEFETVRR